MNRFHHILAFLLTITTTAYSQTVSDAVRYSEVVPLGTARTVGVGSAFGAMGGDFSVIGINPAGLGTYFKSEFTLTPAVGISSTDALVTNATSNSIGDSKSAIGLDNIGLVSSNTTGRNWIAKNWGIGFSKAKSLGRSFEYSGQSQGSITERWVQLADGLSVEELDDFEAFPAYDAGALILGDGNTYSTDYAVDDDVTKRQRVEESGYISELNIAYAANYKNKLNLGISIGIPFMSFEQNKTYTEAVDDRDAAGQPLFQNNLEYIEYLNATGAGINIKAGAIYNFNPVRIGAAIHTPTWYSLDEDFDTEVNYTYEYFIDPDSGTGSSRSVDGSFTYNFATPWKAVGSIGSLLSLGDIKGFINADVEYLDYSSARFDLTSDSNQFGDAQAEEALNAEVTTSLRSTVNYRVGAEIAISKYRLRAGYNYSPSPYVDRDATKSASVGAGYRKDAFFFDIAYRLTRFDDTYTPYASALPSRDINVETSSAVTRVVATFGFKF